MQHINKLYLFIFVFLFLILSESPDSVYIHGVALWSDAMESIR